MSREEANKAVLRRWYDEMWTHCAFDLIPEIAGPSYTRHDVVVGYPIYFGSGRAED